MPSKQLLIELVPSTSWGDNLRSRLPRETWDRLRKETYQRAGHVCEICGGTGLDQGSEWPVECHEIWEYNDETQVQKLTGLIALCPICHKVKHASRTISLERWGHIRVHQHLKTVNGWTDNEASQHIDEAFRIWGARSQKPWTLDITWLAT